MTSYSKSPSGKRMTNALAGIGHLSSRSKDSCPSASGRKRTVDFVGGEERLLVAHMTAAQIPRDPQPLCIHPPKLTQLRPAQSRPASKERSKLVVAYRPLLGELGIGGQLRRTRYRAAVAWRQSRRCTGL